MNSFFKPLIIVVTIVAVIAILTKPNSQTCYDKVNEALEKANHHIALYISHEKGNEGKMLSSITIKDRIFYKDIYFFELGVNKKVARGAFTKIFLIDNPK
ncbi:MAG: hypothetical protein JSS70_07815 [Bacteroidetes bacterium]|nr:hypothetical protein [Bacteroidota bacterium]